MKQKVWMAAGAIVLAGTTASAALIASESFHRSTAGGDYLDGTAFGNAAHSSTLVGNTGFSAAKAWHSEGGTTLVTPRGSILNGNPGITNPILGAAKAIAGSGFRTAFRELDSTPSGTSFFMGGLVQLVTAGEGRSCVMGLGAESYTGDAGVYLGMTTTSEGTFLAAFNGLTAYTFGPALTGDALGEAHQIVLKIEFGAGPGADSLTAWYAPKGAINLILGTTLSGLELGEASGLGYFTLQGRGGAGAGAEMAFDEFRFGTTLDSVTTVSASLIVSESFQRSTAGGDYLDGTRFNHADHSTTLVGNTGFSAGKAWYSQWDTGNVTPRGSILNGTPGITNALLGAAEARGGSGFRTAYRELNGSPAGTTFYMSGLVQSVLGVDGKSCVMGLGAASDTGTAGVYLGMTTTSEGTFLAVFNGLTAYTLGSVLTGGALGETHQIVLKVEFGAGANSDSLTAWYAGQDAAKLSSGAVLTGLELGGAAGLSHFTLQGRGAPAGNTADTAFDEFRFGLALDSVTSLPAPRRGTAILVE